MLESYTNTGLLLELFPISELATLLFDLVMH